MALTTIFLVLMISSPAAARMGSTVGSSIVVLDPRTGRVIRQIAEPCMYAGHTFSNAFVDIEATNKPKRLRLRWDDVVFSTSGYVGTRMDDWGAPEARTKRELVFLIPEFSTYSAKSVGAWQNVEMRSLPATVQQDEYGEATLTIKTKEFFYISRAGEALDAFTLSSGKKLWTLDLNPTNNPLPGGGPSSILFEHGNILLVASDRLGLHAVNKKTGEKLWHLPYHNLDVFPKLVLAGGHIVIAPADMGTREESECSEVSQNNK